VENPCYLHHSRITFADTDCSGWIHFPKIFRHVEEAEHAYLRQQGLVVISRQEGGWPRVHVECDYKKPLNFDDEIEVRLGIERIGAASVSWIFEVARDGEIAAFGKMTTVRVDPLGKPVVMDDEMRRKLLPPG
jgi:YbgC/YbaW family acyl-CoA thioester hydrolase